MQEKELKVIIKEFIKKLKTPECTQAFNKYNSILEKLLEIETREGYLEFEEYFIEQYESFENYSLKKQDALYWDDNLNLNNNFVFHYYLNIENKELNDSIYFIFDDNFNFAITEEFEFYKSAY